MEPKCLKVAPVRGDLAKEVKSYENQCLKRDQGAPPKTLRYQKVSKPGLLEPHQKSLGPVQAPRGTQKSARGSQNQYLEACLRTDSPRVTFTRATRGGQVDKFSIFSDEGMWKKCQKVL